MSLPEQELERIGMLASRVLDGDATDAECADLARLRSEYPEVRELCSDLEAGQAAFELGAGSAPLPSGFAQQVSFRAMRDGAPATISTTRLAIYWGAAAASIAAAVAIWMSLDDGGTRPAPRKTDQSAKQDGSRRQPAPERRTPTTSTDSLFPERAQPKTPAPAPENAPDPAPEQRPEPESPRPEPEKRPTLVEKTPTLPTPAPETQPERELPPETPQTPEPSTPSAVVVANFDQFDGRSLSVMQPGGEWTTIGEDELPTSTVTSGAAVRASAGTVSLALQQGGYAALDRGAEVAFAPMTDAAGDALRVRVGKGHVFMDLDERSAAVTAECGVATVELDPGSRVTLDVSANEVSVAVLEGNAVVHGTHADAEPKRLGRHASLKVGRTGRPGSVAKRSPRLRSHERRFLERRFQREGAEVFGGKSRWGASGTAIERQARDLMSAGATPREIMPLLKRVQKLGYEGPEAVLVMRALHASKKLGLPREQTSRGLHRVLMQRHRGKALETALQQWLKDPAGANGRPDKAGRGREGRPDKHRKPGKGAAGKAGKKPGKGGKSGIQGGGKRG